MTKATKPKTEKFARLSREELLVRVEELLQPLLEARGVDLVDLEYARPRQGRATLRLFLDRTGGITLDELARLNRVVGEVLEVHDLIPGSYHLELSSPGLTREFKKEADYRRYAGRMVRITTREPWQGRQVHQGILQGLEGQEVTLKIGEEEVRLPLSAIAKAKLAPDLKNILKEA